MTHEIRILAFDSIKKACAQRTDLLEVIINAGFITLSGAVTNHFSAVTHIYPLISLASRHNLDFDQRLRAATMLHIWKAMIRRMETLSYAHHMEAPSTRLAAKRKACNKHVLVTWVNSSHLPRRHETRNKIAEQIEERRGARAESMDGLTVIGKRRRISHDSNSIFENVRGAAETGLDLPRSLARTAWYKSFMFCVSKNLRDAMRCGHFFSKEIYKSVFIVILFECQKYSSLPSAYDGETDCSESGMRNISKEATTKGWENHAIVPHVY